ncbi:hypothetical protein QBC34DRAFT_418849 [Podospora aff. communis PSN243]|uniref:C2H2-type domain-containing protein n=1 Tax=Podospora aff. communis PSN243 TaxID=3040156 RepID=A0AAV9G188_9PEZI|nr:hypothetical protein QBC34DRAFT_418849 [Podospora aff. communis PSN243]
MPFDASQDSSFVSNDTPPFAPVLQHFDPSQPPTVATEHSHHPFPPVYGPLQPEPPQPPSRKSYRSKRGVNQQLVCTFPGCKNKTVFPRKGEFDRHLREHFRPISCPVLDSLHCVQGFSQKKQLHRHLWVRHRDYAALHKTPTVEKICPYCGIKERSDNLKRHIRNLHERVEE